MAEREALLLPGPEALADLEAQIDALDALPESGAEASAKRRVLLIMLDQHGFFDPNAQPALRRVLRRDEWPRLAEVGAAAEALTGYLDSAQRAARFPRSRHDPPAHAGVSLDWFRHPGRRPDLFDDPLVWTAWCEAWLVSSRVGAAAGRGEAWAQVNEARWVLRWRTDDGQTPALVSATEVP